MAGAADGGDSAQLGSCELDEKGRTALDGKLRGRPRGEERCSLAMADAWKLAAGHSRRYGVGASQRSYCFFV